MYVHRCAALVCTPAHRPGSLLNVAHISPARSWDGVMWTEQSALGEVCKASPFWRRGSPGSIARPRVPRSAASCRSCPGWQITRGMQVTAGLTGRMCPGCCTSAFRISRCSSVRLICGPCHPPCLATPWGTASCHSQNGMASIVCQQLGACGCVGSSLGALCWFGRSLGQPALSAAPLTQACTRRPTPLCRLSASRPLFRFVQLSELRPHGGQGSRAGLPCWEETHASNPYTLHSDVHHSHRPAPSARLHFSHNWIFLVPSHLDNHVQPSGLRPHGWPGGNAGLGSDAANPKP